MHRMTFQTVCIRKYCDVNIFPAKILWYNGNDPSVIVMPEDGHRGMDYSQGLLPFLKLVNETLVCKLGASIKQTPAATEMISVRQCV